MELTGGLQKLGWFVYLAKPYEIENYKIMVLAKDMKEAIEIAKDYYKTNRVHVNQMHESGTPNVYLM